MVERSVVTRLRAEIGQYKQAMDDAAKATRQVGDEQDKTNTKSQENSKSSEEAARKAKESADQQREAWNMVGTSLLAVGTGITALGVSMLKTGVEYNTLQQTTRAALTTLLGSASAAGDQMDRLDEFARNSPFAKSVFIQAQQQMLGFGVATKDVLPALDAIQNTVAAFGGGNEQIAAIAEIMSRIKSEGRLSGDALQRLGYYGVDAAQLIGDQMGLTATEIRDMAGRPGGIPVDQIWDPLVNGMQEKFGGAADNVKNTFAGAIDRVKAAWRDLSSALAEPFVGTEGGGIFTGLLNETADLMRGFEDLPGPVKFVASSLTLLTGAAALLGGGLILLVPRIAETKAQLEVLRRDAPGVAGAVDKASVAVRGLGMALAAVAVYQIAKSLVPESTVASAREIEAALTGIESSTKLAKDGLDRVFTSSNATAGLSKDLDQFNLGFVAFGAEVNGLTEALEVLRDTSGGFIGTLDSMGGLFGIFDTQSDLARKSFESLDAQMASLVESGNLGEAEAAYKQIATEAERLGMRQSDVNKLLPEYRAALEIANEGMTEGEIAARDLATEIQNLDEQWKRSAQTALGMSDAAIAAAAALAEANELVAEGVRVSFDQNGALDLTNEKTREAQSALNDLAGANLANIEAMKASGVGAAELDAAMLSQRDSFIATAEAMGYTKPQAEALATAVGLIPRTAETEVGIKRAAEFWTDYAAIVGDINALTVKRTVEVNPVLGSLLTSATGWPVPKLRATGGHVSGPGTGTSDSIPALLSNGEHVLTAAEVRKMGGQQKVYAFRQSLNAYATGGAVDFRAAAASSFASGGAVMPAQASAGVVEHHWHVDAPAGTNTYQLAHLIAGEQSFAARGVGQGGF